MTWPEVVALALLLGFVYLSLQMLGGDDGSDEL